MADQRSNSGRNRSFSIAGSLILAGEPLEWNHSPSNSPGNRYDGDSPEFANIEDELEEEDETFGLNPPAMEPRKEGLELLASGEFGRIGVKNRALQNNRNIVRTLASQRSLPIPLNQREDIHSNLVPNTNGTTVASYQARIYTASFSNDSSFFYTCAQDFRLHIFDMRHPRASDVANQRIIRQDGLVTRMSVRKVIQGRPGNWTITDTDLSPNNDRMIYSSLTPTVYMTCTAPEGSHDQIPIHFGDDTRRHRRGLSNYEDFDAVWSCRFSADGNEVIAGGSGKIFVYDLRANKRTVKIFAHNADVNSCCWADSGSGNVLVSASDDTFLKIWDRRSLGATKKPSGVLIGHTEGIAYVSAKGDGRYIISNGKDQALRLWDLRKMRSNLEHEAVEGYNYGIPNFDYRYSIYTRPRYKDHPQDCSVMTYRGHSVLETLIRCHFSPSETTGAQYIYSGSADGRIHIWSLDGRIVHVLDRSQTLSFTFDPSGPEPPPTTGTHDRCCVRDVSWHTQEPLILSAGWNRPRGTDIAQHEYKGLSKMTMSLEDWVERDRQEAEAKISRRSSYRALLLGRRPYHEILDGVPSE